MSEQDQDQPIGADNTEASALTDAGVTESTSPVVETDDQAVAGGHDDDKKKSNGIEKRFSELTKQREEQARRAYNEAKRADALEKELAAIKQQVSESMPEARKPRYEDYDTDDAYSKALDAWADQKATVKAQKLAVEQQQAQRQANEQREKEQKALAFQAAIARDEAIMPGLSSALETLPADPELVDFLLNSERATAVLDHFRRNPHQAYEIAQLSDPISKFRRLASVEAETKPVQQKINSDAPPPVEPINGSAPLKTDMSEMTIDDWMVARNAQLRDKRGLR